MSFNLRVCRMCNGTRKSRQDINLSQLHSHTASGSSVAHIPVIPDTINGVLISGDDSSINSKMPTQSDIDLKMKSKNKNNGTFSSTIAICDPYWKRLTFLWLIIIICGSIALACLGSQYHYESTVSSLRAQLKAMEVDNAEMKDSMKSLRHSFLHMTTIDNLERQDCRTLVQKCGTQIFLFSGVYTANDILTLSWNGLVSPFGWMQPNNNETINLNSTKGGQAKPNTANYTSEPE